MKPILLLWLMLYLSVVAHGEKFNLVGTLEKQSGEMVDLLQGRSDVYYITDSSGMEKWACLPGDAHHSPDCRDRYTGFLAYKKLPYVLITLQSGGQIKFDTVRECSVTNRDPESMYRTDVFCKLYYRFLDQHFWQRQRYTSEARWQTHRDDQSSNKMSFKYRLLEVKPPYQYIEVKGLGKGRYLIKLPTLTDDNPQPEPRGVPDIIRDVKPQLPELVKDKPK